MTWDRTQKPWQGDLMDNPQSTENETSSSEKASDPAILAARAGLTVHTGLPCFSAVIWLLGRSEPHRKWLIADIDRYVIPPLVLNQAWLFLREQKPVGFFSWANLTLEAEQGMVDGTRLIQPEDWNAGTRRWSMDVIAPFGDLRTIFAYKKAQGFPNGSGRYQRLDKDGKVKRTYRF